MYAYLQETAQDKRDPGYAGPGDDKATHSATCLVTTDLCGALSKLLPSLNSRLYKCLREESLYLSLTRRYHRSHEGNRWFLISRAKLMGGIIHAKSNIMLFKSWLVTGVRVCTCVCASMCETEREKERQGEREETVVTTTAQPLYEWS